MQRRRFLGHNPSNLYHVMSRTTGGDFLFQDAEKFEFRRWLTRLSEFSGVRVIAWCCMTNHFHVLVEVPERGAFVRPLLENEEKLLKHLRILYSKSEVNAIRSELKLYRTAGHDYLADELLIKFTKRMCDLGTFMKELKQRLTLSFNRRHERKGTLWMAPYKSVLLEGAEAMAAVAAYIDLNPVRAGLVQDPKDYRFCSYAEAVAGHAASQRGLCRAMGINRNEWRRHSGSYRALLFGVLDGDSDENVEQGEQLQREYIEAKLASGAALTMAQLLRCRIRYFVDGGILGTRQFLETYFHNSPWRFGSNRVTAARKMSGGDWAGLFSIRDLQKEAVRLPDRRKGE